MVASYSNRMNWNDDDKNRHPGLSVPVSKRMFFAKWWYFLLTRKSDLSMPKLIEGSFYSLSFNTIFTQIFHHENTLFFLFLLKKYRLWVLVRTASAKKYQSFLSDNFLFLEVKFSIYLNRHVFVKEHIYSLPFHSKTSTIRTSIFYNMMEC